MADQPVYELKNWRLQPYSEWTGVSGNVYGNPKFAEGFFINTSRIENIEIRENAFLLCTHNSVYLCRFGERGRDAGEGFEELDLLTKMGISQEKAEETIRAMEQEVRDARKRHEEKLLQSISENDNEAIILELSAEDEYYYRAAVVKKGGEHLFLEDRNIRVGQTQDSVYIGGGTGETGSLLDGIDFSYVPRSGNRADFIEWTGDRGVVYIYNSGSMPMEVDTPFGRFIVPVGKCYPITKDSVFGRLQDPKPAETSEIFNTCIDERFSAKP